MTMERDERLSALLDGALAPAEEAALRAELARDPALAAQYEELARVDAALRALPARPVPADLRARLQTKIAAEARAAFGDPSIFVEAFVAHAGVNASSAGEMSSTV